MTLKALIVDDEYPAREELRYLLSRLEGVEVVGEATNGKEALALITALDYDMVFLDINMPQMDGMDLGEKIKELEDPPAIVYITAYDQYALQAFRVNAVDYLLKPIEEEKLSHAVERIRNRFKTTVSPKKQDLPKEPIQRLSVEQGGKIVLLDAVDVYYAFSEGSYVYVATDQQKYLTKYTLQALEEKLDPKLFFRCHRSYLVNLKKIKEIAPFFKGTYNIRMTDKNNTQIPVSRRQAKHLKQILDL
ncbi:LytTR family transcriptional regulator DNA-binding domain-containing protein [Alkalibacter rhizosphaerae]|uniref:Stage 0 sporulation protein A homolog n=1 Tax=Alkalibacter rhizosphaerae TaxID=2815577 RepID=A0A975AIF6_9FIRM|nr:LytTR family transcriptional regulator DNA-binding domain-containing protein [Alkalibacter rhizosphaerae]QSX09427.1 LytTR family transcriptional regulator DNA-binding domain-containing protein [Alkalibacter rhizosphaerae]